MDYFLNAHMQVPSKKKVSNPQTADVADNQFVGNSMLVRVQGRYHPAGNG